jgi:hypothetical protein
MLRKIIPKGLVVGSGSLVLGLWSLLASDIE